MISIHRSSFAGVTLGLVVLCSAACGGKDEPAGTAETPGTKAATQPAEAPETAQTEAGEPGKVRYSGETESGEKFEAQIGGDVKLPGNLPAGFPIYPTAVPFAAMELAGSAIVSFDSQDQASTVYQFYTAKLPDAGWKIDNEINMGGQRLIKASKGDQEAEIRVEATEGGARISCMVQPAS